MASEYVNVIVETAEELQDELTECVEKGGHSTVYFGEKYVYKVTEKKVMEKSRRINAILSSGNEELTDKVPRTVLSKDLDTMSLVVEELKDGVHPNEIDGKVLKEIVRLLDEVHSIGIDQVLTNFEGDEELASEYWNAQLKCALQYVKKLKESDTLDEADSELIKQCTEIVADISTKKRAAPKLVLVYKDVHRHNTLVDKGGKLSALIDWDAAMSGPVELEYAVLWHRLPELWNEVRPANLDKDTFVLAGIVQGLRFWKSFTKDSNYVDQQREALKKTLDLHQSTEESWEDEL